MTLTIQPPTLGYAKITQRIAAFFYDIFLYAAAFIVVGAVMMIFIVNDLPGSKMHTLGWFTRDNPLYLFVTWIILPIAFFGWFWTRGGQTLSMRSWRIRIETLDGNTISWLQSALRLSPLLLSLFISFLLKFNAPLIVFSVGFICMLWSLVSKKGQGLNDIIAGTRVIRVERGYVPPKKNSPSQTIDLP